MFFPRLLLSEKDRNQKVLELSATWVVVRENLHVLPSYSKLLLGSTARWSVESLSLVERDKDSKPGRASGWKAGNLAPPRAGRPELFKGREREERSGQRPLGKTDSLGLSGDDP